MNFFTKKNVSIIGIIIAILFLVMTTSMITLYSDDFYYISFFDGGFSEFVQNNINHYLNVNGRVLVHILDEICLNLGKIPYILTLVGMLLYIFYTSNKIILSFILPKDNIKNNILYSTCLSMILFLFIDVCVLKETAFWITRFF